MTASLQTVHDEGDKEEPTGKLSKLVHDHPALVGLGIGIIAVLLVVIVRRVSGGPSGLIGTGYR